MPQLILASSSPRRRELLTDAGFIFDAEAPDIDETQLAGEDPAAFALRIAIEKAQRVVDANSVTIGADTVVVAGGAALGKPDDPEEAVAVLQSLSGDTHRVMTGWALAGVDGILASGVEVTRVAFRALTTDEIERYVASGEPLDRAGSYAIQGGAGAFVESIEGSYSNVMGLPIETVTEALARVGVIPQPDPTPDS